MTGRRSTLTSLIFAFAVLVTFSGVAGAQDGLRTAFGAPDLQGVWDFRTITPLQRPEDLGEQAFLTEEEASQREQGAVDRAIAAWDRDARRTEAGGNVGGYNNFWMDQGTNIVGTRRTSLIVAPSNGRIPEMTDAGQARRTRVGSFNVEVPESYTELSNADRCIMGFNAGPPITPGGYNQNMQLFQTPDHVVLVTEMVHTTRVIPIDGQPGLDDSVRQWSGDSRGHWEGDTLVIETTNFSPKFPYRGSGENRKLVERYTRVDENTLEYEVTIEDPTVWAAPWTVRQELKRQSDEENRIYYEPRCHEGNYGLPALLIGARVDEQEFEAGRGPDPFSMDTATCVNGLPE